MEYNSTMRCSATSKSMSSRCALEKFMSARAANIVLRCLAVVLAGGIASLFFFTDAGANCLVFAGFLLVSAFTKSVPASKISFVGERRIKRGLEIKYVLTDGSLTYRRAIRFLDDKKYVVFRTADGREITQDELFEGFTSRGIYDKVFGADDGDGVSGETESAEESEEESGEEADLSFLP